MDRQRSRLISHITNLLTIKNTIIKDQHTLVNSPTFSPRNNYALHHPYEITKLTIYDQTSKGILMTELATLFDQKTCPFLFPQIKVIRFKKNDTVIQQGEISPNLWYIHKGSFSTTTQVPYQKKPLTLATLKPNDIFGEISFIDGSQSTATVTAIEHSECWTLRRELLPALYELYPTLALKLNAHIATIIAKRIRETIVKLKKTSTKTTTFLTKKITTTKRKRLTNTWSKLNPNSFPVMPELANYHTTDIKILCRTFPCFDYPKDSKIFAESDLSYDPYLILQGAVQTCFMHKRQLNKLSVIGPGQYVGAVSFVDRRPRPSTAFVREHAILMQLSASGFQTLKTKHPALFLKLSNALQQNITKNFRRFLMHLLRAESLTHLS